MRLKHIKDADKIINRSTYIIENPEKYDLIFKDTKRIEIKTDNDDLFNYSCESLTKYGYKIIEKDTNHISDITTEYEDKFRSIGKNINYISVVKE